MTKLDKKLYKIYGRPETDLEKYICKNMSDSKKKGLIQSLRESNRKPYKTINNIIDKIGKTKYAIT